MGSRGWEVVLNSDQFNSSNFVYLPAIVFKRPKK